MSALACFIVSQDCQVYMYKETGLCFGFKETKLTTININAFKVCLLF